MADSAIQFQMQHIKTCIKIGSIHNSTMSHKNYKYIVGFAHPNESLDAVGDALKVKGITKTLPLAGYVVVAPP